MSNAINTTGCAGANLTWPICMPCDTEPVHPDGAAGGSPPDTSGVTVSVTVCWTGVLARLSRSASTIRIALMIARAPSTPAAHSRAR